MGSANRRPVLEGWTVRRTWARVAVIALEVTCLFGSAVLLLVPLGFNRGLVSVLVNVAVPVAVIVLLRKDREASPSRVP